MQRKENKDRLKNILQKDELLSKKTCEINVAKQTDNSIAYKVIELSVKNFTSPLSFLMGNPSLLLMREVFSHIESKEVGLYIVETGIITYDGIVIKDENILFSDRLNMEENHCKNILNWAFHNQNSIEIKDYEGVLCPLFGPGWPTWGHWLVEFLPRIFLIQRYGININEVKFLLPFNVPKFALDLVKICGLSDENIIFFDQNKELMRSEKIIVPTNLSDFSIFHPVFSDYVEWICGKIGICRKKEGIKKIFIQRTDNNKLRTLVNRKEIERIAQENGYELINPNILSVTEQIEIFWDATHICGEYGSGLHSSIFSRRQPIIVALRGNSFDPGFIQNGLAKSCKQKIGYVFGDVLDGSETGDFIINNDLFLRSLKYADSLYEY